MTSIACVLTSTVVPSFQQADLVVGVRGIELWGKLSTTQVDVSNSPPQYLGRRI